MGANARFILSTWVTAGLNTLLRVDFPYGTLFVNAVGSFLLAVFTVWFTNLINPDDNIRLLVGTGFFGAFTTFSTFSHESISFFQSGNTITGIGYILLTNLICLSGVLMGIWVASR